MKTAVIGGGISGLTTAYLLMQKGIDVTLFEKNSYPGGNIKSEYLNGYLVEHGPSSTLETSPLLNKLFEELGILERKIYASEAAKKRYILKNGKLYALPMSPPAFIKSRLFSASAKFRLLKEPFIKTKSNELETIAEFTERRLGKEFLDYAINPFVAGVFAGNPNDLNVKSAFPKLYELEQKYGSLIGGMIKSRKERKQRNEESKQSAKTFSFKNGLIELVNTLFEKTQQIINTNSEVVDLRRIEGSYTVTYITGDHFETGSFDNVILCVPANLSSRLIKSFDKKLSAEFANIYYPPVTVIATGFKNADLKFVPDGFGFLIPEKEKRKILGTLWNSAIFRGRAPEGHSLLTNFIGGSRQPELALESDDTLLKIVMNELQSIMGVRGNPEFVKIIRWRQAIPQYSKNHAILTEKIESLQHNNPGLQICSNYYKGISVCDCIKNAYAAADKVQDSKKKSTVLSGEVSYA